MASIDEILAKIAKDAKTGASDIKAMANSLKDLAHAKNLFMAQGDPKGVLAIQKMTKAIEELNAITIEYKKESAKLKEAQKKGIKLTDEEIKSIEKIVDAEEKARQTIEKTGQTRLNVDNARKKYQESYEADALRNWRTNTKLGKSYDLLSSGVAGFAAKVGFVSLAIKAWNRHVQAAEVQQKILIQNYQGLSSGVLEFTGNALAMSKAMASTEATAQRMGVSTEYVGEAFTKFSRITGTKSPEVLKTLSEGAITVSRSLGIDVPEAIDYVSTRMDKFGGSAASAIIDLNHMREEVEGINTSFGRTVVRGDDVVRTLSDISKQTTIYAIDQRFVGGILRENIARLQANGASYEAASRQAHQYTEAVTGKMPEWMQVFSSYDISDQILKSFNGKELNAEMKKEINAAKPGLAEEIESMLVKTGGKLNYSTKRYLGEVLSATSVGISANEKQILKLAKHEQGLVLIKQQFNLASIADAKALLDQTLSREERLNNINKLTSKTQNYEKLGLKLNGQNLNLTKAQLTQMKAIDASGKTEAEKLDAKKNILNQIMSQEDLRNSMLKDRARLDAESLVNQNKVKAINEEINSLQQLRNEEQEKANKAPVGSQAKKDAEAAVAYYDKMIKDKKLEKTRYESKAEEAKGKTEGLKTVEDINKKLLDDFQGYADNSGGYFKSIITQMSDTKTLLMAAVGFGIAKSIWKYMGIGNRLQKILSERAIKRLGPGEVAETMGAEAGGAPEGGGGDAAAKEIKDVGKTIEKTTKAGPKQGRIKRYAGALKKNVTWEEGKYSKAIHENAMAFSIGASLASQAMDKLTATYDKDGNEIETANSKLAKSLKGFSGEISGAASMMSMLPGKMGKLGGAIGGLTAAWEIGVTVGQGLNKVFDKMGWTGEDTTQKLADIAESSGDVAHKFLKWAGLADESPKEKADTQLLHKIMKRGLSEDEAKKAILDAQKSNMGIGEYLAKMGKMPALSGDVNKPTDANKAPAATVPPKTGALTGAKIPAGAGAALGATPDTATGELAETAAPFLTTKNAATAATAAVADTGADTGGGGAGGGMTGSFVGGPNSDGSITLRVENFMSVFAKASTMAKQKSKFA